MAQVFQWRNLFLIKYSFVQFRPVRFHLLLSFASFDPLTFENTFLILSVLLHSASCSRLICNSFFAWPSLSSSKFCATFLFFRLQHTERMRTRRKILISPPNLQGATLHMFPFRAFMCVTSARSPRATHTQYLIYPPILRYPHNQTCNSILLQATLSFL
jgi:hypothetical protein